MVAGDQSSSTKGCCLSVSRRHGDLWEPPQRGFISVAVPCLVVCQTKLVLCSIFHVRAAPVFLMQGLLLMMIWSPDVS